MSKWIKRSEQEPREGEQVFKWDQHRSEIQPVWISDTGSRGYFTHWQPANVPDPPPRVVTIEISEEDAREWAATGCSGGFAIKHEPSIRLYEACRKALERGR